MFTEDPKIQYMKSAVQCDTIIYLEKEKIMKLKQWDSAV